MYYDNISVYIYMCWTATKRDNKLKLKSYYELCHIIAINFVK